VKICSKCLKNKDFYEFSASSKEKDGLQYQCKQCQKEYRQQNREKINEINRIYRKKKYKSIKGKKKHKSIKGKTVSGLHVWENLQILEVSVNISKGNKI